MKMTNILRAGLFGLALSAGTAPAVQSETLRVMSGAPSTNLNVPMNRAVVVESDVVFAELSVANPLIADIATLSDRTLYVLGKSPGRTTLTLLGPDGRLITNVDVQVSPDVAEFKERLREVFPGEGVEIRTANDGIVLSGTISSILKLDRVLDLAERYAPGRVSNLMMVGGTHQVMLKVRFAEMQRSVRKALSGGLTISGINSNSAISIGGGSGGLVGSTAIGSAGSTRLNLSEGAVGSAAISFDLGGLTASVMLEALESKGLVRTLAEPNLTALSGQEAKFLAGGEIPIPIVDNDGGVKVEYKPFGVALTFTPTVVNENVINVKVDAAVSSIDPTTSVASPDGLFSFIGFRTRRTSTTVEMRDGESFAIAGLLLDDFRDQSSQVPWLGDIPILGALFRSADYTRDQSELVIIITPHLVNPISGEAFALPTDRIRPPTEAELFLFGNLASANRSNTPAGEVARQDFSGSYGYVME